MVSRALERARYRFVSHRLFTPEPLGITSYGRCENVTHIMHTSVFHVIAILSQFCGELRRCDDFGLVTERFDVDTEKLRLSGKRTHGHSRVVTTGTLKLSTNHPRMMCASAFGDENGLSCTSWLVAALEGQVSTAKTGDETERRSGSPREWRPCGSPVDCIREWSKQLGACTDKYFYGGIGRTALSRRPAGDWNRDRVCRLLKGRSSAGV